MPVSSPKHLRYREIVARAWGSELQQAREAARVSKESLARREQINRTYASLLQRGPTLPRIFGISDAQGLNPAEVVARAWAAYCRLEHVPEPAVTLKRAEHSHFWAFHPETTLFLGESTRFSRFSRAQQRASLRRTA